MSRDVHKENVLLRQRLREAESLLRVAAASMRDDPARAWLYALLAGSLVVPGEPEAPDDSHP